MKKIYFFLTMILLMAACQSEEIDTTISTPTYNPPAGELVDGSIRGTVVDTNGEGIASATIRYNDLEVQSDDKGIFKLSGQLDAGGTYLTVTKPGYFNGSRKFSASADDLDFVTVRLVPRIMSGTVSAAAGGVISVNDAQVELPGGVYRTVTGAAYNGEVQVYAHYMDPTAEATFEQMPGDLTGFTTQGELRGLVTYGMVNVELQDASGNALQLPAEQTATLVMDVPAELQGTAPASIPLWYFDDAKGIWVEEGAAELVNGEYIGQVSHFTVWNCDDPFEFVTINGSLNFNNNLAANFTLQFTAPSLGLSGYTTTNNRGHFSIKVPKDEALTLTVSAGCGNAATDIPLGSYSIDTNIGVQNVSATVEEFTIVGSVQNCGGGLLDNGVVKVYLENTIYNVLLDDNGEFEHTFSNCTGIEAFVAAIDRDNSTGSDLVAITASGYQDVGVLETCNDVELNDVVISYAGQNWALEQSAVQDSTLLASYSDVIIDGGNGPDKTIRTITILDWLTGEYAQGDFTWTAGDTEVNYIMSIPQGFSIAGTCDLQLTPFFKVTDTSTDIIVTDITTYPGNVDEVYFHIKF